MTREELFDAWAPAESVWTPWVKAVVFAHWNPLSISALPAVALEEPAWLPPPTTMAVIVDLPGASGVACGLGLARLGYRPVPLYRAAPWPDRVANSYFSTVELIDVRSILAALLKGAESVAQLHLPPDAPPAFLLDANRQTAGRFPQSGDFDNRSISLPTDFPSAATLGRHGIHSALLIQSHETRPQADLAHTLGRWSGAGIEILSRPLDGAGEPAPIQVKPPGAITRFFHGLFATAGFRRNHLGGFGGIVPAAGGSGAFG